MKQEIQEFNPTKSVLNIIEFDKENELWRVCEYPDQIFPYSMVHNVSVIEGFEKDSKHSGLLTNIAVTLASPTYFAGPSAMVKVQIRVLSEDGNSFTFDISKKYVQQNTLDYHKDKREAALIKEKLRILEKRNHS